MSNSAFLSVPTRRAPLLLSALSKWGKQCCAKVLQAIFPKRTFAFFFFILNSCFASREISWLNAFLFFQNCGQSWTLGIALIRRYWLSGWADCPFPVFDGRSFANRSSKRKRPTLLPRAALRGHVLFFFSFDAWQRVQKSEWRNSGTGAMSASASKPGVACLLFRFNRQLSLTKKEKKLQKTITIPSDLKCLNTRWKSHPVNSCLHYFCFVWIAGDHYWKMHGTTGRAASRTRAAHLRVPAPHERHARRRFARRRSRAARRRHDRSRGRRQSARRARR